MRIVWIRNGRTYEGTPVEIVQEIQRQDVQRRGLPLGAFVDYLLHEAKHWGFELTAVGDSDEERATTLVASMIGKQLAKPF